MSEKISEYATSVTALASGDLMDVSKLISTSPDIYQSQKLNYSLLLTELNADLTINNLGNSDLTSTDNARYFKLNGTTSSNFLKFRNSIDISILSLFGDKSIVFGNSSNPVSINFNIDASDATGDTWYRNSGGLMTRLGIGTSGQVLTVSGGGLPTWATISTSNIGSDSLVIDDNARYLRLKSGYSTTQYFQIQNTGGENLTKWLGNGKIEHTGQSFFIADSNGGQSLYVVRGKSFGGFEKFRLQAEDNQGMLEMWGNQVYSLITLNTTGTSYFYNNLAIGVDTSTARFLVKGSGSTSATTTALFQNSSSVAALTIKDDLTSTFGGIITTPQVITTPATITVAANAGTVTRANRINNFTNSSAATMTITMSTTAALDGDMVQVRIYDFSAAAQTITWVNTENSSVTVPATSNGSTTLPLTVGFQYNSATSKWRCIGSV